MYFSFSLVSFSLILHCLCSSLTCISSLGLNPSNCHQNMSWTKRLTNAKADMVQNCSDEVSVAHISPKPFENLHENIASICLIRITFLFQIPITPCTQQELQMTIAEDANLYQKYKAVITLARPSRLTHLHKTREW